MAQEIEQQNKEIINLLGEHPTGLTCGQVSEYLSFSINDKTLQRRLAALVEAGCITRKGERKATRYHPLQTPADTNKGHLKDTQVNIFSPNSQEKLKFLDSPLHARDKVSYNREFLDSYVPDESQYVPN